jgi:hypothetical protein
LGSTASQNSVGASTVLKGTSATNSVLTVNTFVTGALIKGVYFDRSVTATGGAGIFVNDEVTMDIENCKAVNQFYGFLLGATNFGRIYNSQAEQCYSHGFAITQNTVTISPLQWIIDTCISQANNGGGFVIIAQQDNGSGQGTVGPRCNASGTFANAQIGWQFTGAVPINDVTCIDCYSSFDGQGGWDFEKVGTSIELIGCFAEGAGLQSTGRGLATGASHVGVGLLIESGGEATAFVNLVGFISRQNSFQGIGVASNAILKSLNLTNCQFYDNGQYGHTYGIDIEHTTVIVTLTGCTSRNDNTSNQTYGLHAATPANIWATACDFSGNATGGTDNLTSMNAIACNGVPEQLIAFQGTTSYANDAAAAAGGVLIGGLYRNGSVMQIRIA